MTMVPVYKICSRCKRKYSWNPDVGKMWCPYCGSLGMPSTGDIPWRKIRDVSKDRKNKYPNPDDVCYNIIGVFTLKFYTKRSDV